MKTKKNHKVDVIQLRDDLFVNGDSIDYIAKTNKNPFTNEKYDEDKYFVVLKDCTFKYVILTKEEFVKYIQ